MARSKINIRIDNIPLRIRILIVPDEQLSKEVIIGRDILSKPGVQAISNATEVTFTLNRLNKRDNKLEVNVVNVDKRKAIEINDIYCGELDGKDRVRLAKFLNDYRDCISLNFRELGKTSAAEMKIELKDDEPVYHKPYRLSKSDREKVLELVANLENNGIVRESTSPYGSACSEKERGNSYGGRL